MSEPSPIYAGPQLTPLQWHILGHISSYIETHGYSPSLAEIARLCDMASASVALHHVCRLEALGVIVRDAGVARSIRITAGAHHADIP